MIKVSDTRPNADVEYLSSAIIRDAMTNKFNELFGRDPVSRGAEDPMKVEDTRVPDMIANSVDSEIAKMLKASAVETSKNASGSIPDINSATLIYTIHDTSPAEISLGAVEEYRTMDTNIADTTTQAVSEQEDINIGSGIAYLSSDLSTIDIGIFVDNKLFASEFQYMVENAGGNLISSDKKVALFDELFNKLPGGDNVREDNLRDTLLNVVGLTTEATPQNKDIPKGQLAPGPQAEAVTL